MRYLLILTLSIISFSSYATQNWKSSSCSPTQGGVSNSFDCNVVTDDAVSWCYEILQKTDQWRFSSVQVSGQWSVRCAYKHLWNGQGSIQWGKNTGNDDCPSGKVKDLDTSQCIDQKTEACTVGNPISVMTGNKVQTETDLSIYAFGKYFSIERKYNSERARITTNINSNKKTWLFKYDEKINYMPVTKGGFSGGFYVMELSDGTKTIFKKQPDGTYESFLPERFENLTPIVSGGSTVGWTTRDNIKQVTFNFGTNGFLTGVIESDGTQIDLQDSQYRFTTDIFVNGVLLYQYHRNSNWEVTSISLPTGESFTYEYDTNRNLIKVINPDLSEKGYIYDNVVHPQLLTGIIDENQVQYVSWDYNSNGLATLSEHAGSFDIFNVDYTNLNSTTDPRIVYNNPLGHNTTIHFDDINGKRRPAIIEKEASLNAPAKSVILSYNNDGYLDSKIDGEGNTTNYTRDSFGRELSRTEAVGLPEERTITTAWDSSTGKPSNISTSINSTVYSYDVDGKVLSKSLQSSDGTRTWTFTYNSSELLETIDGPRLGISDITTINYDSNGRIAMITDPLNHITTYNNYHYTGKPQQIIDENGVVSNLVYNFRGQLTSSTIVHPSGDPLRNKTILYSYDNRGLISRITQNNGSYLDFEYNDARYLTAIVNDSSERYELSRDSAGNVTNRLVRNDVGTVIYSLTKSFNSLSQIVGITSGEGISKAYSYDANYLLETEIDGSQNTTEFTYDGLNRISQVIDANLGMTSLNYDEQNRIITITDPRGLITSYDYSNQGDNLELDSPDTDLDTKSYDDAGNVLTSIDSRGIQISYSYDALNRLTNVIYPTNPSENVIYSYDDTTNGNYGIGKLTGIADESGSTSYIYDHFGNVTFKNTSISGQSYLTSYEYNDEGVLIGIVYPSGREIELVQDNYYRTNTINMYDYHGAPSQAAVSNVSYYSFGPIGNFIYGNGVNANYSFNLDYKLEGLSFIGASSLLNRSYEFDASGNISNIFDIDNSSLDQIFTYDFLNRLDSASGNYGQISFDYDENGNRTEKNIVKGVDTTNQVINYPVDSNKSGQIDINENGSIHTISTNYDVIGNIISRTDSGAGTTISMTYNNANRMSGSDNGINVTQYKFNAIGQRVLKTNSADSVHYHYDEIGRLIAESSVLGEPIKDYIYLGDELIYVVLYSGTAPVYNMDNYAVLNDHLSTPIKLVDDNQIVVWSIDSQTPFGNLSIDEDPDGDSQLVELNARFPGQYFDLELGLNYNYYRYYDSTTGRYIQSDPIGLKGGISTYAYAGGNPLSFADPFGLEPGDKFETSADAALDAYLYILRNHKTQHEYHYDLFKEGKCWTYSNPVKTSRPDGGSDTDESRKNLSGEGHTHGSDPIPLTSSGPGGFHEPNPLLTPSDRDAQGNGDNARQAWHEKYVDPNWVSYMGVPINDGTHSFFRIGNTPDKNADMSDFANLGEPLECICGE